MTRKALSEADMEAMLNRADPSCVEGPAHEQDVERLVADLRWYRESDQLGAKVNARLRRDLEAHIERAERAEAEAEQNRKERETYASAVFHLTDALEDVLRAKDMWFSGQEERDCEMQDAIDHARRVVTVYGFDRLVSKAASQEEA